MVIRSDGRSPVDLRPVNIVPGFIRNIPGSVLIELGDTRVICTATVQDDVPQFLRDRGRGWITAEYGMLPGSSTTRIPRESTRGRVGGRRVCERIPFLAVAGLLSTNGSTSAEVEWPGRC